MTLHGRIVKAAVAASFVSLAACGGHSASKATQSLATLLDFSARETARIASASPDRPPRLDLMLIAIGQPNPNILWRAGLRTTSPFYCQTPTRDTLHCAAGLGAITPTDRRGAVNVVLFDHDVSPHNVATDMSGMLSRKGALSLSSLPTLTTQSLATANAEGAAVNVTETCGQVAGIAQSGPAICSALLNPRTLIVARIEPGATASSPDIAMAQAAVAATAHQIDRLRAIPVRSDGSFDIVDVGTSGGREDLAGPGWYLVEETFGPDLIFAGPYPDQAGCVADTPAATTAISKFTLNRDFDGKCEQKQG